MKNLHGWTQPPRPPFTSAPRLIELLNLLLKHVENAVRRATFLELGGEWVRNKVLLCTFFVCFQGIIEYNLEVRGCGSLVSMRHKREVRN